MKTSRSKRALARVEKRIEQAYYRSCAGVQIDIMDIGTVFKAGHELIAKGVTEPELEAGIRAAVDSLNKKAADEAVELALRRPTYGPDETVLKALQSHKPGSV